MRVTIDGGTPAPTADVNARVASQTSEAVTGPAATFEPTPPPSDLDTADLHGFAFPIAGACLPSNETLMPGAPRPYRNAQHEAIDFYFGDSCVVIERGTPVLAVYRGVVTRADYDYVAPTADEMVALDARIQETGTASEEDLDALCGRQVWIDHGNGVVTRYCHLESVEPSIGVGRVVPQGAVIGGVGESGTPESLTAPGTELHLNFEVYVDGVFLGQGHDPETVRSIYTRLFQQDDEGSARFEQDRAGQTAGRGGGIVKPRPDRPRGSRGSRWSRPSQPVS